MLLASNLPKNLWGYAILHANYIKNHMHTRALPDKTLYGVIHQKKKNQICVKLMSGEEMFMLKPLNMTSYSLDPKQLNG